MSELPATTSGHFRLRSVLIALFLGIAIVISSALLFFTYRDTYRAVEQTATAHFQETATRLNAQISLLISAAQHLAILGQAVPLTATPPTDAALTHPIIPFFQHALRSNPTIYSLYYGYTDGSFLQMIAVNRNPSIMQSLGAPPQTVFAFRAIYPHEQGREQTFIFLDDIGHPLGEKRELNPAYDPRQRVWYQSSQRSATVTVSPPYQFSSIAELGMTIAHILPSTQGVFGVDVILASLEAFVAQQQLSPHAHIILATEAGSVLAAATPQGTIEQLSMLQESRDPLLRFLGVSRSDGVSLETFAEEPILVSATHWQGAGAHRLKVLIAAPLEDFLTHLQEMQRSLFLVLFVVFAAAIPIIIWITSRLSRTIHLLADDAHRIEERDFGAQPEVQSFITEFTDISHAFQTMKSAFLEQASELRASQQKLQSLIVHAISISDRQELLALEEKILAGAIELTESDGGVIYCLTDEETLAVDVIRNDPLKIKIGGVSGKGKLSQQFPLKDANGNLYDNNAAIYAAAHKETVEVADIACEMRFDFGSIRSFDKTMNYCTKSLLIVPLCVQSGAVMGVLQLSNARKAGEVVPFAPALVELVTALASLAAAAMQNRKLLLDQEKLLNGVVQLLGSAIDAKSPYTGRHCQRVPELAQMIAEAAHRDATGPLAPFTFATPEEWDEFRLGAWLHDCGKVITPEHVIDKSTKLETIYNRIHEIRMRFEVLLRDARIEKLHQQLDSATLATIDREMAEILAALQDDFAFIAHCNVGEHFLQPQDHQRLQQLATHPWQRFFDDQLGLSYLERQARQSSSDSPPALPQTEALLANKPWQHVPRAQNDYLFDPALGFRVECPANISNTGELYNLSIPIGTLSAEERFTIQEHVMQSIRMLHGLPFPKSLKRILEYAGSHHEALDGNGYPYKLTAEEISVPARIIAVADIFEALTAADRPYKSPKKLSESLAILAKMRDQRIICPDIFALFLRDGIYQQYAKKHLLPEQVDEVDINNYLPKEATA